MKAKKPETHGFEWETIFSYPAMGDCTGTENFKAVRDIISEVSGKVSYGSEGGVFEEQGNIPSIICGPGSIEQAHRRNEFVEISQLEKCLDFLENSAIKPSSLDGPRRNRFDSTWLINNPYILEEMLSIVCDLPETSLSLGLRPLDTVVTRF